MNSMYFSRSYYAYMNERPEPLIDNVLPCQVENDNQHNFKAVAVSKDNIASRKTVKHAAKMLNKGLTMLLILPVSIVSSMVVGEE